MQNKKFASVAAATILGITLSACGGGEEEGQATAEATQSDVEVIAPEGNPVPTGSESAAPSASPTESTLPDGAEDRGININPSAAPTSEPSPEENEEGSGDEFAAPDPDATEEASPTPDDAATMGSGEQGPPPAGAEANVSGPSEAPGATNEGGSSSEGVAPSRTLPYEDGAKVAAYITGTTPIYSRGDVGSEVIGEASIGGQFMGTVRNGGKWIEIDRSPGFVKADDLRVESTDN